MQEKRSPPPLLAHHLLRMPATPLLCTGLSFRHMLAWHASPSSLQVAAQTRSLREVCVSPT